MEMSTSSAKALVRVTDSFSLLSGIYPKIFLSQSNDLNAFAGYDQQGQAFIQISKPMFEIFLKDGGAAAAVLSHEMAHLYFKHQNASIEAKQNAAIAGAIVGTLLEVLFIGRFGVAGLGSDIGNAFSSGISSSYSRDQEREADRQGMIWALQAGYDPDGAKRLFAILEKNKGPGSFFSSHPSLFERSESAKEMTDLFKKYKSVEVLVSPELLSFNKAIDEDKERQLPKSESGKLATIAFSKKDYLSAKASYEECAKSGEIACINNLGVLYQFGLGVPIDKGKAIEYYKEASDKGSGLALQNYIVLYVGGNDGPLDTFKLIKLMKEASERGSATSMGTLAMSAFMSQSSGIIPQEWKDKTDGELPKQATLVNYAKAAAMRGVKDGQTALGYFYLNGYGVLKNINLAENYLILASNANDPRADAALITLYENEKIDQEKAQRIKDKYKNSPSLTAHLSVLMANYYCKVDTTPENNAKCFDLVKKGRSSIVGPVIYGYVLSEGIGTKKDPIEGNAWLLYAKNKTGHNFATWAYERNIAKLNQAEVEKIISREKEIATSPNTQP
jgi:TPR repeat protein